MTQLEIDLAIRLDNLEKEYEKALAVIEILAKCNSPSAIMFLQRYKAHQRMNDRAATSNSTAA